MAATPPQSWEYLETLQGVELHRLYRTSPPSALAIYRKLLSGLAKHYVTSLLFSPTPMPVNHFELVTRVDANAEKVKAFNQLKKYNIVRETTFQGKRCISIVPDFARSYRRVLDGRGEGNPFGQVSSPPQSATEPTIEKLDAHSQRQWDGILGYMVGGNVIQDLQEPGEELPAPAEAVVELLRVGHLVTVGGTQSRGRYAMGITAEGFAFVLQNINTQIWRLLFLYVEAAEQLNMDKIDVLSFIFFIASLELGLAYSTEDLTETQLQVLTTLSDLGVVYLPDNTTDYFYPTRLASTLTSDSSDTLSSTANKLSSSLHTSSAQHKKSIAHPGNPTGSGFIILETNYRLYAYTTSPLQIALLSLFISLRSRHNNLVTGKLTKASVQQAINTGITAEQIISYLSSHAHPVMRRHAAAEEAILQSRAVMAAAANSGGTTDIENNTGVTQIRVPVVPSTVVDQIHLWQLERDRIQTTPGYFIKEFQSEAEYRACSRYAEEIGVRRWYDDRKRMFFVDQIEGVAAYMKDRKERASGTT
ncbi:RNA polymerase II transcription factor B 52 kDa subunit [Elasticomyces elasticus]|nr:RNA polymerase II transcription factor B 52 kDa subunit [Elasticomyces elasticus]